jgi:putative FmdB family regulatory protein
VPLYEYRCKQCGHQFEKIQSFSAPEIKECPVCKGEVERLISAPAVQFKGSGWYVTDYAGKGNAKAPAKSSDSNGSPGSNTDKPAAAASSDSSSSSTPAAAPSTSTKKGE